MSIRLLNYFELLSFITSLLVMRRLKGSILLAFVPFLGLTVFIELFSQKIKIGGFNHWIYNIYLFLQYYFWAFIFYNNERNKNKKKGIVISSMFFFLFAVYNLIFLQGIYKFNHYTIIISSLLIIIFSCTAILNLPETKYNIRIYTLPFFWFSFSALLFFSGCFLYFSAWNILVNNKEDKNGIIYITLFMFINVIHYTIITIGLLCTLKQKT